MDEIADALHRWRSQPPTGAEMLAEVQRLSAALRAERELADRLAHHLRFVQVSHPGCIDIPAHNVALAAYDDARKDES